MKRNLDALANKEYDLVVIGGGIFGAAAAWEAASRGLSVVLLERNDFAQATSNNHFRMVHGGIRYIQHLDLYRVRESSKERSAMLRIAPHLVSPLPIAIPTYGHGMQGMELLRIGTMLFDMSTLDRNRDIPDPARHIPPGRTLSKEETLQMFPHLNQAGLTGSLVFHDAQIYHPARLALAFIESAVYYGADVANYVEVRSFIQKDGRVTGVQAYGVLENQMFEVRGRMVLNAAGPWAAHLLEQEDSLRLRSYPTFSRDACFVVNRRLLDESSQDHALTVLGRTKDPDAIMSRGHRHLFLVPWQENTLVGVWHVVYKGNPDKVTLTEEDLSGFIDEINGAYPALQLTLKDVARGMYGLTLFGQNEAGQEDLSYGKRSRVIDHRETHGVDGLITMIGVRATTARGVSEKVVDLMLRKLGRPHIPSRTTHLPIAGGGFGSFDTLQKQAERERPAGMPEASISGMVHNYGLNFANVLALTDANPYLAAGLDGRRVTAAEVVYAVRQEMAQKLSDVVFRRTDLGNGGYPGDRALVETVELMAQELGWDQTRQQEELDDVRKQFVDAPEQVVMTDSQAAWGER